MDDALSTHLAELESLITAARQDGEIDADERAALADLLERVRDDIAAEAPDRDGVIEQLERAEVNLETSHPTLAAAIRSAVQTLNGLGM